MANFNNILSCANGNLAHNGANSDITSLSGLLTPLRSPGRHRPGHVDLLDGQHLATSARRRWPTTRPWAGSAWVTRLLETTVTNTISGASLASNKVTLPAGTYAVAANAPFCTDCGRQRAVTSTASTTSPTRR
jgi:hypothetical protein